MFAHPTADATRRPLLAPRHSWRCGPLLLSNVFMKLHIVPARTGMAWVKLGVRAFWRQPMALAALFFMTMAAMSLATMIPLVGPAIALALLPSATLAMMVAAAQA